MAFKLTKQEIKTLADHRASLAKAREAVTRHFDILVVSLAEIAHPLNDAIRRYNDVLTAASEFVTGIAEGHRSEYDERSDGWRDGDRGSAADAFISEWEGISLDELDEVEIVEPDAPDMDTIDALNDLPEEADA